MAESEEEVKSCLIKVKGESENIGLKLNIQKTKIMASSPITSWQIEGGKVETVTHFIFLGSKITADGDFSREIKRHLLFGRKAMTNLDSMLKSWDITLPTNAHIVKAVAFLLGDICMCEWTIRKDEWSRINAFELWFKRRLLRVLWIARRSNQSVLKEINPKYLLEGLMLKLSSNTLANWYEEPSHWKRPWCWEKLKAKGDMGGTGWDG